MNGQDLKNSILQLAIQGKLVEQRAEEGTAKELIEKIKAEKEQLIKEKKINKEKPLPKITEEEIPFEIPESWEWVRLGNIISIESGKGLTSKQMKGGSIPVYGGNGITGYHDKYLVCKETVVIGRVGFYCGSVHITENKAWITDNAFITTYPEKYINREFLVYMLRHMKLGKNNNATAQPVVSGKKIYPLLFSLAPLEEQKRIVAKIEELMPYIEQYDKAYTKVEALNKKFPEDMQKSILQYAIQGKLVEQRAEEGTAEELYNQIQEEKEKLIKEKKIKKEKPLPEITEEEIPFEIPENWKWVRLGDVFRVVMGQSPKGDSVFDGNEGVEFHQGKVFFGVDYIKKSNQFTTKPTKIAEANSVLLCVRAPVGIANIVDREICIGRGLCAIKGFNGISEKFILYFLRALKNDFIKKATGTTFVAITGEVVKNQLIPLPPLEEQKRIVAKIEELLPYCKQLIK
ncbi:restriction endonuclease subunit S [uncultured Clostridium sp.]|uniref:restriction endonuclease subunit S n=1 Tax=uncultured Clostridium sp. TaxID=59620 RepID=UPI0025EA720F|nr:restriction endonuclease subunit S [uncultured Clostridium sp.]